MSDLAQSRRGILQQGSFPIKLFYTSNIPIILLGAWRRGSAIEAFSRLLSFTLSSDWYKEDHWQPNSVAAWVFVIRFRQTALVSNLYFLSQLLYRP